MRARLRQPILVLAVLGLTVAVSGCGDDETTDTTAPAASTAPATTTLPATAAPTSAASTTALPSTSGPSDELQAMLLEASDLGEGWQEASPINEADLRDLAAQIAEPCDGTALNPTIAGRLAPHDAVQFEPSDGSYMHIMETIVAGEPDQLARDVTAYLSAVQACIEAGPAASGSPETAPVSAEYTEMAIPAIGEQSHAWSVMISDPAEGIWYGRTAVVRVGGVAIAVSLVEVPGSPDAAPTVSDAEFVDMVTTAAARLPA